MNIVEEKENDSLILMDDIDRKLLLDELDNYYLTYRDNLGFNDGITFGFEIEFEKMKEDIVNKRFEKTLPSKWIIKNDSTLHRGGEINTDILTDNIVDWSSVKDVLKRVREIASVGINTGSHIHIGTQVLGDNPKSWLNFIKLWSVYENIIYRFCYGEYITNRPGIDDAATPVADIYWDSSLRYKNLLSYKSIIRKIDLSRSLGVNVRWASDGTREKKNNTIEFRCPNGTLNEVIWQNNLNLFVHLLLYAKSNNFDEYRVEKRKYINRNISYNLHYYDMIDIDMALELSDMIFNSNIDKLYFLRQYIKSFQIKTNDKIYEKAKPFTKIK